MDSPLTYLVFFNKIELNFTLYSVYFWSFSLEIQLEVGVVCVLLIGGECN